MPTKASPANRSVPMNYNRAATALVHCRRLLDGAREETKLAVRILEQLDDPGAPWPKDPAERLVRLRSLECFVAQLEEARRYLEEAWVSR